MPTKTLSKKMSKNYCIKYRRPSVLLKLCTRIVPRTNVYCALYSKLYTKHSLHTYLGYTKILCIDK